MSKVNLIYQLKGEAVNDGINVFELSPLLLSMGNLIQESYSVNSNTPNKLAVNVKPFRKGSFEIELLLYAQNNLQQILGSISGDTIQEIRDLLETLGIVTGSCVGVIQLLQFLKGQPKRFEQIEGGDVRVEAKDGNSITINKNVFNLFQNSSIQNNLYEVYGNFLGREGIDSVKSFVKDEQDKSVEINKTDVPYFNPGNAIPLEDENGEEKRNITKAYLKPKRISVEGEPDNWSFRKSKDNIITATVKDDLFLSKIESGEIRLYGEDILEADLLEIQTIKDHEITTKYEVLKVREYKKAPIQKTLLDH